MKILVCLCALTMACLSLSYTLSAADTADGGDWKLFGRYIEANRMRAFFVQGIYEGALAMNQAKAREVFYYTDYTTLASAVSEFYSDDDDNADIPVTHALYIVSMRMKGKSKDAVDDMIKKFRGGLRLEFLAKQ
ncbi:MAG: hypothetical protein WCI77_03795 [Candidatus Omnitrophota bacterium]